MKNYDLDSEMLTFRKRANVMIMSTHIFFEISDALEFLTIPEELFPQHYVHSDICSRLKYVGTLVLLLGEKDIELVGQCLKTI